MFRTSAGDTTYIKRNLVEELHRVTTEHDGNNPPINFVAKSLDFTRGFFHDSGSSRMQHVRICLVDSCMIDDAFVGDIMLIFVGDRLPIASRSSFRFNGLLHDSIK